jgi:hypothetical protein
MVLIAGSKSATQTARPRPELLALTWLAAFHMGLGESADRAVLSGFVGLATALVHGIRR